MCFKLLSLGLRMYYRCITGTLSCRPEYDCINSDFQQCVAALRILAIDYESRATLACLYRTSGQFYMSQPLEVSLNLN